MEKDRFIMYKDDVTIYHKEKEPLKGEKLINFLKEKRNTLEKLNIGDVVELKDGGDIVTIEENNGEFYTYEGSIEGMENLILFDNEDIERVISRKK